MQVTTLADELGVRLHLKAELFQKTGSFKPRGVFNKLLSMSQSDLSRGLVSMSAGNHAAALAYGATAVGARATIVMPATAMPSKVEATKRYGGEVVQTEGSVLDACLALQRERDLTLVHPFDDLAIMGGQGTVGLEFLQQVPNADVVVVPGRRWWAHLWYRRGREASAAIHPRRRRRAVWGGRDESEPGARGSSPPRKSGYDR